MKSNKPTFSQFFGEVEQIFLQHPIVVQNDYTAWFARGDFDLNELKHFTVQFSVFSNFFLVAQLKKMINAETVEDMRSAKEILANEIGVVFKKKGSQEQQEISASHPEFVGMEGSIEGGTFRFQAAHFEWLVHFGKAMGLTFQDLGKRKMASESTRHFCDQLELFYGSEDFSTACGASFAVENWAAAGFWKELIQGLETFKADSKIDIPLGFFKWHNIIEDQHAHHTHEELERAFQREDFDQEKFFQGGLQVLNALEIFWKGLQPQVEITALRQRRVVGF